MFNSIDIITIFIFSSLSFLFRIGDKKKEVITTVKSFSFYSYRAGIGIGQSKRATYLEKGAL